MNSLTKAFSYLIAAHVQAVGLIMIAVFFGKWLNEEYPTSFSWIIVTMMVAIIAVGQTFYVLVRAAMIEDRKRRAEIAKRKSE